MTFYADQANHWKQCVENVIKMHNFEYEYFVDHNNGDDFTRLDWEIFDSKNSDIYLEFGLALNNYEPDVVNFKDCEFHFSMRGRDINLTEFIDPIAPEYEFYAEDYEFNSMHFDVEFTNHIERALHVMLRAFASGVKPTALELEYD